MGLRDDLEQEIARLDGILGAEAPILEGFKDQQRAGLPREADQVALEEVNRYTNHAISIRDAQTTLRAALGVSVSTIDHLPKRTVTPAVRDAFEANRATIAAANDALLVEAPATGGTVNFADRDEP